MPDLKHVGRSVSNKRKCIVAYRVIPKAAEYCLVVNTDSLDAEQHDSLMRLVESNAGQTAYELAEAMQRTRLPDGRNMLNTFHNQGKLVKTLTKDVEMVPNQQTTINLAELNSMIAEQRGVTVEDLALGLTTKEEKAQYMAENPEAAQEETVTQDPAAAYSEDVITDEQLAAQYRSQADSLYKEAKSLRDQADQLDPPKKKATTTKSASKTPKATTSRAKKTEASG